MRFIFIPVFLLCCKGLPAQEKQTPLSLSIFNNGTSLPGSGYAGVFSRNIHPGLTLGTAHLYRVRQKSRLFQTLKLGYFYHRHNQHAIQLYSELGYRYNIGKGFYAAALAGGGYLHSFADVEQYMLENGKYVRKANTGRPQLMVSASLAAGYDLAPKTGIPLSLFLQYQFWLQAPFVKKYVPLLPNTALHLGASYILKRTSKKTTP